VTFSIARLDSHEETITGAVVESEELVDQQPEGEAVIALDGTTLSEGQLAEVREALANDLPEEFKEI